MPTCMENTCESDERKQIFIEKKLRRWQKIVVKYNYYQKGKTRLDLVVTEGRIDDIEGQNSSVLGQVYEHMVCKRAMLGANQSKQNIY